MRVMPLRKSRTLRRLTVAAIVIGVVVAAAFWVRTSRRSRSSLALERLPKAVVQRTDLNVTLAAGGRVDSPQKTLIECELQSVQFSTSGRVLNAGGFSTIIDLIPDGTHVKKGDELCRLDSSDYEEIVRQQQVKVEQAHADQTRARLDVDAAKLAQTEYRKGTWAQANQELRGQITLAEADLQRQTDRLAWARRMLQCGYVSQGQVTSEEQTYLRTKIALESLRGSYQNLQRFTGVISMRQMDLRVEMAERDLFFQNLRVERMESRLSYYQEQVENCTIRAPHDGFLIYANEDDGDPRVQPGGRVHYKMDLFYLPDLGRMEVDAVLNESIVNRVHEGMPARIRVEAMPQYALEGHVMNVSPLPYLTRGARLSGKEVVGFLSRIKLDAIPRGLLPGMTAQVEIETAQKTGVLVIPAEAMTLEEGREVCYVARSDGLERREVKIGEAGHNLLEVTHGLSEGEQVVLDPARIENADELVIDAPSPSDGLAEGSAPAER